MALRSAFLGLALLGLTAGAALAQASDQPPSTPLGSGPYPALMEVDPSLATHTVYRPADMSKLVPMSMV